MAHLRRLAVLLTAVLAVFFLGIIVDGVTQPIVEVAQEHDVGEGPFAPVLDYATSVRWLLVPGMLLGLVLWYVYGTVREERREEVRRRVGP